MKRFPACPAPRSRRWHLPSLSDVCLFRLASASDARATDMNWSLLRRTTDTHGWQWERVLLDLKICVYAFGAEDGDIAALFGTPAKSLQLTAGHTRRLDFFQVAPALRGTEVARLAFAAFARLALDLGDTQLVLGSLPTNDVLRWYTSLGGRSHEPPEWETSANLVKVLFPAATLRTLAEYADAVEQETLT